MKEEELQDVFERAILLEGKPVRKAEPLFLSCGNKIKRKGVRNIPIRHPDETKEDWEARRQEYLKRVANLKRRLNQNDKETYAEKGE